MKINKLVGIENRLPTTLKKIEFMFQNVAYRPTVYRTWGKTKELA